MTETLKNPLRTMRIRDNSKSHTFGMVRRRADGSRKPHQGWDLAAPVGTAIFAVADGSYTSGRSVDYGLHVTLRFEHGGETLYAFYAHLSNSVGSSGTVKSGDKLGLTGKSGNANSPGITPHLHFEIRTSAVAPKGLANRRDPHLYFPNVPLP